MQMDNVVSPFLNCAEYTTDRLTRPHRVPSAFAEAVLWGRGTLPRVVVPRQRLEVRQPGGQVER